MALPETDKKPERREKPLTKVIVRRLPPTIDQETFIKQVSPIPDYNYMYTVNGDFSLGEHAFSRVYINFVNHEDVYNFKERFDNYVFLDAKGNEYPCVVEFAAFQKIPKKKGKARMDPKAGTIESDPYYLDFLEFLKKPQELDEKPEYTLQLNSSENKNDVTTPLLEYIKNKRAQRMRIREVRREERKRREFDKRRDYYDDRRKGVEEKSPGKKKPDAKNEKAEPEIEEKYEKEERYYEKSYYKNKDRRYDDRRFDERRKEPKPRFPRKDHTDYRNDNPKEKKYDYKKEYETKTYPKKVKKYSEKREERKIEAQKAEQKKIEEARNEDQKPEASTSSESVKNKESSTKIISEPLPPKDRNSNTTLEKKTSEKVNKIPEKTKKIEKSNSDSPDSPKDDSNEKTKSKDKIKEDSLQNQKRIRNKDRPTIAIYRPGMLSKRKQGGEGESEVKDKSEE